VFVMIPDEGEMLVALAIGLTHDKLGKIILKRFGV